MPHLSNVSGSLGALAIGTMVSAFLFGALTIQAAVYHFKFQGRDAMLLQILVGFIWFLELGQLGSVFHAIYTVTILHRGEPDAILSPPQTVGASFLLSSCIGSLVEVFYVSRLYKFSSALIPSLLGWALTTLKFGGWIFLSSRALVMTSLIEFRIEYGFLFKVLLSISAGLDLAIALANYYYLRQGKKKTRKQRLIRVLDTVMLWSLQTGIVTSFTFLCTLFCFIFIDESYLVWMAVSMSLTKVMSNCLLGSLNARPSMISTTGDVRPSQIILSSPHLGSPISPTTPRIFGTSVSANNIFVARGRLEPADTVVDLVEMYSSALNAEPRQTRSGRPSLRSTRASTTTTEGYWTL